MLWPFLLAPLGLVLQPHVVRNCPARAPAAAMRTTPMVPYRHKGTDFTSWIGIYDRMYRDRILFMSQPIGDDYSGEWIEDDSRLTQHLPCP